MYKLHTLETIVLDDFIDLYLGDDSKAVAEGKAPEKETAEAAERIRMDYIRIVGGREVAAQLRRKDEELKIQMRRICLQAAKVLAESGNIDDAVKVMESAGYKVSEKNILARIAGLEASDRMKEARLSNADAPTRQEASRETFTRERVALMRHTSMYIDSSVIKAAEYAWMLRSMCDEMRAAMIQSKKTKKRR